VAHDRSKLIRALLWASSGRLGGELVRVAKLPVLAALLTPANFGTAAIASLCISASDAVTQTGNAAALVQRPASQFNHGIVETAFAIDVARAILLSTLLCIAAPAIAKVFALAELAPLIRLAAALPILNAFASPGLNLLERELKFGSISALGCLEAVISAAASIAYASFDPAPEALIYGTIAGAAARVIASYITAPWWPRQPFLASDWRELVTFGRSVSAARITTYCALQLDNWLVGLVLGPTSLGIYQLAFRYADTPTVLLGGIAGRVAFPALSRAAEANHAETLFESAVAALLVITAITGAVAALAAHWVVSAVLGAQWMPMIPLARLLLIGAWLRAWIGLGGWYFTAKGRPEINLRMNLWRLAVLATLGPFLLIYDGTHGMAIAVVASSVALLPSYVAGVRALAAASPISHSARVRTAGWRHVERLTSYWQVHKLDRGLSEESR
jgi:O-antigen/teichoic acid export membrane protein